MPEVSGVEISSRPQNGTTYGAGELIWERGETHASGFLPGASVACMRSSRSSAATSMTSRCLAAVEGSQLGHVGAVERVPAGCGSWALCASCARIRSDIPPGGSMGIAASGLPGDAMRHDQSYKALFSHSLPVRDLLRDFVGELLEGGLEWMQRLDFSTLEPLPTERIDPTLRGRANDIVWRVRFRDAEGGPEWLRALLMLEFQSGIDWFMALRVQGYAVRLYESLWRDRRPGRGDRLPPVLAVVIYNGKSRWRASTAMAGLIGEGTRPVAGGASAAPALTGESYVLLDVGAYKGGSLPPGNLVSLIMATELMSEPGEAIGILEAALRLLSAAEQERLRDTFLAWFRLSVSRTGVDLEFLEDRTMMEQMEQVGALRTTLEERFEALHDAIQQGVAPRRGPRASSENGSCCVA